MAGHSFEPGRHIVGRAVHKKFKGFGVFSGKVVAFNSVRGFYKIRYEDGDTEEVMFGELKKILTPEKNEDGKRENEEAPQGKRRGRKRKRRTRNAAKEDKNSGDVAVTESGDVAVTNSGVVALLNSGEEAGRNSGDQTPENGGDQTLGNGGNQTPGVAGGQIVKIPRKRGRKRKSEITILAPTLRRRSSRQAAVAATKNTEECSGEGVKVRVRRRRKSVPAEKFQLPPSSGDLCVPEESIPGLFYVYNTLRSFSKLLFLSPFTLDDFVAALNCTKANSLVDSVHLALLQALKRHLEFIAPDEGAAGAIAVKCLKQLDWNFLDMITWPVYLVQYLASQGFGKISGQKVGYLSLCNSEYYMTSMSLKISILEFLCNEVMESEEISAEISARLKFEGVEEADEMENLVNCSARSVEKKSRRGRRRILTRNCKGSAKLGHVNSDDQESLMLSRIADGKTNYSESFEKIHENSSCIQNNEHEISSEANNVENCNSDECCLCSMDGTLICCDGCPAAYHSRCVGVSEDSLPEGNWYCPECLVKKGPKGLSAMTGLQGAVCLGIDSHGRVYFSICGYLLVCDSATDPNATYKYYNRNDSMNVLEILDSSTPLYDSIRNAIEKSSDMLNTYSLGPKDKIIKMELPCLNKADNLSQKFHSEELSMVCISESFVQQKQENASGLPYVTSSENDAPKDSSSLEGEAVQDFNTLVHKQDFEMMVVEDKISKMERSYLNKADNPSQKCHSEGLSIVSISQSFVQQEQENSSVLPSVTSQGNNTLKDSSILEGEAVQDFNTLVHTQDFEMMVVDESNNANQLTRSQSSLEMMPVNDDAHGFKNNYEQQLVDSSGPCNVEYTKNIPMQGKQLTEVDAGNAAFQVEQQPEQSDICTACVPGQMYLIANCTSEQIALKLNAYVNQYILGDMAASAAANLAVKAAENKRTINLQGSSRRSASETIKEQMKVFSKLAVQFFWPCLSSKLVEVQKEKCGWCLHCKSSTSSLKDCLLHIASVNAVAGASWRAGGVCCTEIGDGHLPEIVAYVLYLEDQLHCLLDGPWVNPSYRVYWRKYVEQASSISEIKNSLLELELNLKSITLSADWFKPVDDGCAELSFSQNSTSVPDLTPKRGRPRKNCISTQLSVSQNCTSVSVSTPKRGRPRKNSISTELSVSQNSTSVPVLTPKRGRPRKNITSVPVLTPKRGRPVKHSVSTTISSTLVESRTFGVNWWRGGRLSGRVLCQKLLPRIVARRSGRQAGFRKIAGIFYSEGSEIPRRSKQYAWRATVEMAKNVSQLALQIRTLDAFIRWDDLLNMEDFLQSKCIEEKGSPGFRKAVIRAKNSEKGLVKYLVDFGKQKAIPTCIVKHGTKFEDDEDGRKKFWVGDNYVPLYLLKKFQEKARACSKNDTMQFHLLPIKSSKRSNSDVFSFLLAKAEGLEKSSCAHCRQDIFIRNAVHCESCKGFFHRKCILNSIIMDVSEFQFTCCKCHNIKLLERDHKLVKLESETKGVSSHKWHRLVEDLEQNKMPSPRGKWKKHKRPRSLGEDAAEQKQGTDMKYIYRIAEKPKENGMSLPRRKLKKSRKHQSDGEQFAEQKHPSVICMLAEEQEEKELLLSGGKEKKHRNKQMHDENVEKENHGSATKRRSRKVRDIVRLDGILWNNNGNCELGKEFRESKLVLPCHSSMDVSEGPKCYLCHTEYNPQLIYVGCESCKEWFHGDAFRLTMENFIHLISFKCYKCRKRTKPSCPYSEMTQCRKEPVLNIGADNGEMPYGAQNKELFDVIYSRSSFVSNEESPVMLDSEGILAVTEMDFESGYMPNQAEEKIFKSALIPFYEDAMPPEVNFDSSSNNHLQDEMLICSQDRKADGLREKSVASEMMNGIIIQSDPNIQTPSLLSYTELLASEDDKVENLFDLLQDGVHHWSTSVLPADMDVNMSQLHGAVQSPNLSDKIESHQANAFSLDNFINQPYGKGNKFILDERKLEKCVNCDLTEVPPDLQCSGCGIAIHYQCYERAPNGLWNEYGWLCGGCQAGFVQG